MFKNKIQTNSALAPTPYIKYKTKKDNKECVTDEYFSTMLLKVGKYLELRDVLDFELCILFH